MIELYRKFGRVVRRENDVLVRVDEAGEAIEDGGIFSCRPIDERRPLRDVDQAAVTAAADAIRGAERVIVSEGIAQHEFGGIVWTERIRRMHVALTHAAHRLVIDLADFDLAFVQRVAQALRRARERDVPHVRLHGFVGASRLPSLIGTVAIQQWAAPHDGKGGWIENVAVTAGTPPNWFRPSYRVRPSRAWFHLRVEPFGEIDRSLPEAIARLGDGRLLCTDGDDAFITRSPSETAVAAAPTTSWYPYGAGCFGAEIMI